jgi:Rhodopirellula transposase DDE domain
LPASSRGSSPFQACPIGRNQAVKSADDGKFHGCGDQTGLTLTVCHFPPGTSKWNKVEHRLFSFISSNWRDEPLRDYETVVRLIAGTTTAKGLKVICRLNHRKYPVGRKITDEEFAHVNLKPDKFHGEWNYTIHPSNKR